LSIAGPHRGASSPLAQDRAVVRPGALFWLPARVLAAGLGLGVVLWARWELAIAFEAIRTYCL
jgi:hypothetical protein